MNKKLKEDLEVANQVEEGWKEIEKGKGISMDFDDFIKEMKTW